VLRSTASAAHLDHARDAVSPLAQDPTRDQRNEVLEAGPREAAAERAEDALERGGDILVAHAPPSVLFCLHTETIAGWSVPLSLSPSARRFLEKRFLKTGLPRRQLTGSQAKPLEEGRNSSLAARGESARSAAGFMPRPRSGPVEVIVSVGSPNAKRGSGPRL
jgi:hypothetical protein